MAAMRALLLVVLVLLCAGAEADDSKWAIEPGVGVGPVALGLPQDDARRLLAGWQEAPAQLSWPDAVTVTLSSGGVEKIAIRQNRAEAEGHPVYLRGPRGLQIGALWPETA